MVVAEACVLVVSPVTGIGGDWEVVILAHMVVEKSYRTQSELEAPKNPQRAGVLCQVLCRGLDSLQEPAGEH